MRAIFASPPVDYEARELGLPNHIGMDGMKPKGWVTDTGNFEQVDPMSVSLNQGYVIITIPGDLPPAMAPNAAAINAILDDAQFVPDEDYRLLSVTEEVPLGLTRHGYTSGGYRLMITQEAYKELANKSLEHLVNRQGSAVRYFSGIEAYDKALRGEMISGIVSDIVLHAKIGPRYIETLVAAARTQENYLVIPVLQETQHAGITPRL